MICKRHAYTDLPAVSFAVGNETLLNSFRRDCFKRTYIAFPRGPDYVSTLIAIHVPHGPVVSDLMITPALIPPVVHMSLRYGLAAYAVFTLCNVAIAGLRIDIRSVFSVFSVASPAASPACFPTPGPGV